MIYCIFIVEIYRVLHRLPFLSVKFGCDNKGVEVWWKIVWWSLDNPTDFKNNWGFLPIVCEANQDKKKISRLDYTKTCAVAKGIAIFRMLFCGTRTFLPVLFNMVREHPETWQTVCSVVNHSGKVGTALTSISIRLHYVFSGVPFEWPTTTNHKSDQGSTPYGISPLATTFDHLTHLRVRRNDYPWFTVIHHDSSLCMHCEFLEAAHCLSHQI